MLGVEEVTLPRKEHMNWLYNFKGHPIEYIYIWYRMTRLYLLMQMHICTYINTVKASRTEDTNLKNIKEGGWEV